MQAGYDYTLVRSRCQRQHRFWHVLGFSTLAFGAMTLLGGGGYYAYANRARSDLVALNVDASDSVFASVMDELSTEPTLSMPESLIENEQLYPADSLEPSFWNKPEEYEPRDYADQALIQKFAPLSIDRALPLGTVAAPVRIMVTSIGIDSPVVGLAVENYGNSRFYATPRNAVGHIPESANPGEAGSSWFFGHLDTPILREGSVFRDLPKIPELLRQGKAVHIIADNGTHQYLYKVTSTQVLHQDQMRLSDTGQATIHLVTCVPSFVYDQRLIVTGQLAGIR